MLSPTVFIIQPEDLPLAEYEHCRGDAQWHMKAKGRCSDGKKNRKTTEKQQRFRGDASKISQKLDTDKDVNRPNVTAKLPTSNRESGQSLWHPGIQNTDSP